MKPHGIFLLFFLSFLSVAQAERQGYEDARARSVAGATRSSSPGVSRAEVVVGPKALVGGSTVTLITTSRWKEIGKGLINVLEKAHDEYVKKFQKRAEFHTQLKLLDADTFYEVTKTPSWTNALYYRGQILIPMPKESQIDAENLVRSVRHEYIHALFHAVSAGKCPGWLDEGIAQWAEGVENPALMESVNRWLLRHEPVSLAVLQGGFTKLPPSMVPAAYGTSLFAAKLLLQRGMGGKAIGEYLHRLGVGEEQEDAFEHAFGMTEESFESLLDRSLVNAQFN